ncbi:MAG TPA: hypothetical protein VMI54_20060 [Polyangiaceae bacterium]|nr:hypothetical protein [Polyangiaceae bacterium]
MALGGCSSSSGPAEPTARQASALSTQEWKGDFAAWPLQTKSGNSTRNLTISTDPSLCSNHPSSFLGIVRDDTDSTYYVDWVVHPTFNSLWTEVGTRAFSSSPTCVFENPFRFSNPPTDFKFIVAGKGTDNKIYAVPGHQTSSNPQPAWDSTWTEAKTSSETSPTYSGNYGRPAVASNGSLIAMVFMNSDRKIHVRTRATPYASHTWSTIKDGPALPTGVTSDGIPAIAYDRGANASPINKFVVAVTGVASGTAGVYWIYFDGTNWGSSWNSVFLTPFAVQSDPSLEYDDQSNALSLYFKTSSNTILSTSSVQPEDFGVDPIEAVGIDPPGAVAAPRAVFGAGYERGLRTVLTRGWVNTPSTSTILWVEDLHESPFYPYETTTEQGPGCSDLSNLLGNPFEHFGSNPNNNIIGCSGNVPWNQRSTLCDDTSRPCTAAEWNAQRGSAIPTHDYWTDNDLRYSGSGSNACSVSTTTGTECSSPMRVCSASGTDVEGNQCNWTNCGYGTNSPNQYYGGCAGNTTAGTLCCLKVY